jgi:squalene-hopene/tetraprenyl-beta-curcumene cyclase
MPSSRARGTAMIVIALSLAACSRPPPSTGAWDPRAAAAYLDRRMQWWTEWPKAARDHGTFCFSCHTAVPYAMARPNLRSMLGETAPNPKERNMMDDVRKRVRMWKEISPFYFDGPDAPGKTAQSRGTEAVLSALMLAWDDARTGHLTADTRLALDNMWTEQQSSGVNAGSWAWLDFTLAPWEIVESQYYGAALAALAVGSAPDDYASSAASAAQLALLRAYLRREYAAQSLHNRLILLWAAERLPGLLSSDERTALIAETAHAQNPDGGWSLSRLIPSCTQRTLLQDSESDGYATGLATLVLEESGDPAVVLQVQRGRAWLTHNQSGHGGLWLRGAEEFWVARSINKHRNMSSNVGRFMSDAATGYAVLALTAPAAAPR